MLIALGTAAPDTEASRLAPYAASIVQALERGAEVFAVLRAPAAQPQALAIEAASPGFCRLFNEAAPALHGRPLEQLLGPAADAAALAPLLRAAGHDQAARAELACLTRGRRIWLDLRLQAIRSEVPGVRYHLLIAHETTTHRAAAQEQLGMQSLLVGAFQNADAALAITDLQGLIQLANPGLHRLLGFAGNALIGRRTLDLVVEGDRPRLLEARARHADHGGQYSIEARLIRADGGTVALSCTVAVTSPREQQRFRVMTFRLRDAPAAVPEMTVKVAGKIQLIGLDAVRAELGARWAAVADRAMDTAEHIVRRRLNPGDTAARSGDCGFTVCFADATEEDASFRAAMIGREIRQRLIGESSSGHEARVTAIVASVESVPGAGGDLPAVGRVLEERRAALEQRARAALAAALREGSCVEEAVFTRGRAAGLTWVALAPAIRRRIASAAGVLGRDETGEYDVDRIALDLAIEQVGDIELRGDAGSSVGFLVPLGMDALTGKRAADACVGRLQRVDAGMRPRLVLLLGGSDEAMTLPRLRHVAQLLQPLGVKLGLELRTLHKPPLEPGRQPFGILAIPASALCADMESNFTACARLAESLRARGVRVLARHARGREEADALSTMGVDLQTLAAKAV